MKDRNGLLRALEFFVIVLILIVASSQARAQDYAIRSELCYQHEEGTTWDNFGNNIYVSGFMDYQLYESEPWDFSLYVTPKVVYNAVEGLDLYLGFRVDFWILDSAPGLNLFDGAEFPTNFLQDCNAYLRINLYDEY